MSTPFPAQNRWVGWLWGRALPLSVCTLLAVAVGQTLLGEAGALSREGMDLQGGLALLRRLLTLAFILLIAAAYLTRAKPVVGARGFMERVFPIMMLVAGPAGVVLLSRQDAISSPGLATLGLLLGVAGGCVTLWALAHLKTSFSIMMEARRLVTTGPYGHVRHPLYLGEALVLFGLCMMIGTTASLLFALTVNALQLLRARFEEAKLARQFPEYQVYRDCVPFILPSLR